MRAGGKESAKVKAADSWYAYLRNHWRDNVLPKKGKPFEEAFYPEESHAYIRDETLGPIAMRVA